MELAQTGSNEAIAELIRMVEGRHRRRLSWYSPADQLVGVEALGETSNQNALDYLKKVYGTVRGSDEFDHHVGGGGSEPRDDDVWTIHFKVHTYPNAKGMLAGNLAYKTVVSVHEEERGEIPKKDWGRWVSYDYRCPEYHKAHKAFETSIAKLEAATQDTSSK